MRLADRTCNVLLIRVALQKPLTIMQPTAATSLTLSLSPNLQLLFRSAGLWTQKTKEPVSQPDPGADARGKEGKSRSAVPKNKTLIVKHFD
jgi:hypothetical protein